MPGNQDVLVAIPTLNEAARIEMVYRQLLAGLPDDRNTRIVVVDGGSNDQTPEIIRALAGQDPNLQLLDNPKRLQSAAINLAARQAAPAEAYLVRADAHTDYPPGFVAGVVAKLQQPGIDAVVVPMDSVGSTCTARAIAWVSDTPLGSGGSAHRGGTRSRFVDHGHHAGWRLPLFRAVGGYDESYSHNEDAELDCRINTSGGRIWLDAQIRLTYHVRKSFSGLFRQYRNYGRGRSRTVRRHPGSMRLRQVLVPLAMSANVLALLGAALVPAMLIVPALYGACLLWASLYVAWHRRSWCGLLSGLAAATMHAAWSIGFLGGMLAIREPAWRAEE